MKDISHVYKPWFWEIYYLNKIEKMLNPTNKGIFNATLNAYKILANKEMLGFSIRETLKTTENVLDAIIFLDIYHSSVDK